MSGLDRVEDNEEIHNVERTTVISELKQRNFSLKKELNDQKTEKKELVSMLKISQEKAYDAQEKAYELQGKTIEMQEKINKLYKVNDTLLKTIETLKSSKNEIDQNLYKDVQLKKDEIEAIRGNPSASNSNIIDMINENIFKYETEVESYILYIRNKKSKIKLSELIKEEIENNGTDKFQFIDSNIVQCFNVTWVMHNLKLLLSECYKIKFQNITTWDIKEEIYINRDMILESSNGTYFNIIQDGIIMIDGEIKAKLINFHMINCHHNMKQSCIQIKNKGSLVIENSSFISNVGTHSIILVCSSSTLELINSNFDSNRRLEKPPSCIFLEQGSNLILKKCNFVNQQLFDECCERSDDIISGFGNLNISDCYFENYTSEHTDHPMILSAGGGIAYITNSTFKKSSILEFSDNKKAYIYKCLFEENGKENLCGGAIILMDNADAVITNCEFLSNCGYYGGAICSVDESKLKLISCKLQGNKAVHKAEGLGGAIHLGHSSYALILDCLIKDNWSQFSGGAISILENSIAEISKCSFENNRCFHTNGFVIYANKRSGFKDIENKYSNYNQARDIYIHHLNM